jgi:hypothetical protein
MRPASPAGVVGVKAALATGRPATAQKYISPRLTRAAVTARMSAARSAALRPACTANRRCHFASQ